MDVEKFWEKTYRRNIGKMIGTCYRYVSDRQLAEDLSHDAFLKAVEKFNTFKGIGSFDAWLMQITVNTVLTYLRTQKISVRLDDIQEIENEDDEELNIIQKVDFSQEELLNAIHQLPEHHRLVFNLYVFEHFTHDRIGKELGIGSGTSKSHLARARKKLQKILSEQAKEKQNKKERKMLLLLLFPCKSKAMDCLYKTKLSKLSMQPNHTMSFHKINWATMPKHGFKMWFSSHQLPVFVGVPICAIGIFMASQNFNSEQHTTPALETCDSMYSKIDENICDSTVFHPEIIVEPSEQMATQTQKKPAPVVIKKTIVKRETVIVKDTIKIIDSINYEP